MKLGDIKFGDRQACYRARAKLPKQTRELYSAQFGLGFGNEEGEFMGFSCSQCHRWSDCGHDRNCVVGKMERR